MGIHASLTLTPDQPNLEAIRGIVAVAERLGTSSTHPLLDGGHIHVNTEPRLMDTHPATLGGLRDWLAAHEQYSPETSVVNAEDLALELTSTAVEEIECGSHPAQHPTNLLVNLHPACRAH